MLGYQTKIQEKRVWETLAGTPMSACLTRRLVQPPKKFLLEPAEEFLHDQVPKTRPGILFKNR